ncbi:MAG: c-type cytochrome [bacterium]
MPTTLKIFAIAVLPLFLLSCGTETKSTELQRSAAQLISTGADLYTKWNCGACHGDFGEGTPKGPPLQNLEQHWNRQALARYLANPGDVLANDVRLKALAKRYRPVAMPAFDELTEQERMALAAYVLTFD